MTRTYDPIVPAIDREVCGHGPRRGEGLRSTSALAVGHRLWHVLRGALVGDF